MFRKMSAYLAKTDIFFYTLLWLIIIVSLGTIAQKEIGLYDAQQKYLSSIVFWWKDILPLPGGYTTMFILFTNLLAKLVTDNWKLKNIGTIVVHIGSLLLLLGGVITVHFSKEGNMLILEGKTANYFSDYYNFELIVTNISTKYKVIFNEKQLQANNVLNNKALPFIIIIHNNFKNCSIIKRSKSLNKDKAYDIARFFELKPNTRMLNNEHANAGLSCTITDKTSANKMLYLISEHTTESQIIVQNNSHYNFELRHAQISLPFSITLLKFIQEMHPGTQNPKKYTSKIIVIDRALNWQCNIEMNQPLRYKGYTLYQASFVENINKMGSILAVVKNAGHILPYISSIIMCIGLLAHLVKRLPILLTTNRKA